MSEHRRAGSIARWSACFALVLGAHAAGAVALLDWRTDVAAVASGPAILIELAPAPAAPAITANDVPPGPQQPQAPAEAHAEPKSAPEAKPARPEPIEKPDVTSELPKPVENSVDIKPTPVPETRLTAMPPPRPTPQPRRTRPRQRQASLASAPSAANQRAPRPAATAPGAARRNSEALPNWKSRLVARLERYRRYPHEAQQRGEHGVVQLAFNIDRRGGVHNVRILRSSGSSLLDRATLALPHRAAPLPPPPADLAGQRIPVVVPIRYNLR